MFSIVRETTKWLATYKLTVFCEDSGHGSQIENLDSTEEDGMDEGQLAKLPLTGFLFFAHMKGICSDLARGRRLPSSSV